MGSTTWLAVHVLSAAVLAGVGWVVQVVVYPGFALVGAESWQAYHDRHSRAITAVVALPWLAQGVSTAALLIAPPAGRGAWVVVLAVLAAVTVVVTGAAAVPAHGRLGRGADRRSEIRRLLRANLVRTVAWTGSAVVAVVLLV